MKTETTILPRCIILPVIGESQHWDEKLVVKRPLIQAGVVAYTMALFFLLAVIKTGSGQPVLSFRHLTGSQGLSQNHVYSILQDYRGFMWFGTQDGLNKYDGYRFTTYKNIPGNEKSLTGNFVRVLFEDRSKNLWVGTLNGLNRYDRTTDTFIRHKHQPHDAGSISSNEITSICEDAAGNIWVGTTDGLNRFDRERQSFTRFHHNAANHTTLADNFVTTLYSDSRGVLWIGYRFGKIDLLKQGVSTVEHRTLVFENAPVTGNVSAILEDTQHHVWVGTTSGLLQLDHQQNVVRQFRHKPGIITSLAHDNVYSLFEDSRGNLWVGTLNSGLNLLDKDDGTFFHYVHDPADKNSISNNTPSAIYEDPAGTLWVGVHRGGVNYFNPGQQNFRVWQRRPGDNSLSNNSIKGFAEDHQGRIWIATDGGKLNLFDRDQNNFTHFDHHPANPNSISSDVALSVLVDRAGTIWIGTLGGGLERYDAHTKRFKHYHFPDQDASNDVWYIMEDEHDNLWIGDYDYGFYVYDRKLDRIRKHNYNGNVNLASDDIRVMFQDSRKNIWVGTFRGGLSLFDPATSHITRYQNDENNPKSLSHNEVLCIFEDAQKRLWIGTRAGLNLFDPQTKSFKVFNQRDGLPNDVIQSITADDKGNLWLGTLMGLSKFNPDSLTVKTYTEADGLMGNEFSRNACLKTHRGELLFGGIDGFTSFHPDSIRSHSFTPPVRITNFQIFNKPVAIGEDTPLKSHISEADEIVLSHRESVISFEFAALNYMIPEKNRYAYKLEGFDADWNDVGGQRTATYTNLDAGTYTFKVKAANHDGIWNDNSTDIKITITPPFWKTWWFNTAAGILLVSLLMVVYKARVGAVERKKRILEKMVRERTEVIVAQNEQLVEQQKKLEAQRNSLEHQKLSIEEKNKLLENQQYHLEKLVDERTAELLKMNMELMDKNERFGQYGFMTSHNFRGPVASLLGLCNIFDKSCLDPGNLELIQNIEETTLKIDEMIRDMSFLLEQETHLETLFQDVKLEDVVSHATGLLEREIVETNAAIAYDFSACCSVRAVPVYINSIFYHLMSNAIKFRNDERPLRIEIRTSRHNGTASVMFKDNGNGINLSKYGNNIFHPFKRFQANVPGKGLGLYVVKSQMKAMNGDVRIESQPGDGATFTLVFKA